MQLRYHHKVIRKVSSYQYRGQTIWNNTIATFPCIQVYEVTMFCTRHKDHNVVTAALENLYQVLQCRTDLLLEILLSPNGIAPTITSQLNALLGEEMYHRWIN